jgi:hypothetical protein
LRRKSGDGGAEQRRNSLSSFECLEQSSTRWWTAHAEKKPHKRLLASSSCRRIRHMLCFRAGVGPVGAIFGTRDTLLPPSRQPFFSHPKNASLAVDGKQTFYKLNSWLSQINHANLLFFLLPACLLRSLPLLVLLGWLAGWLAGVAAGRNWKTSKHIVCGAILMPHKYISAQMFLSPPAVVVRLFDLI